MSDYETQPWMLLLAIVIGLALLAGLIWCNLQVKTARVGLLKFRGNLRVMAIDKHQQVKMANTLLKQIMTISTVSLLPKMIRLPVTLGKQLVGIKR